MIARHETNIARFAKQESKHFAKYGRKLAEMVKKEIPELTRVVLFHRELMFEPADLMVKVKHDGEVITERLNNLGRCGWDDVLASHERGTYLTNLSSVTLAALARLDELANYVDGVSTLEGLDIRL